MQVSSESCRRITQAYKKNIGVEFPNFTDLTDNEMLVMDRFLTYPFIINACILQEKTGIPLYLCTDLVLLRMRHLSALQPKQPKHKKRQHKNQKIRKKVVKEPFKVPDVVESLKLSLHGLSTYELIALGVNENIAVQINSFRQLRENNASLEVCIQKLCFSEEDIIKMIEVLNNNITRWGISV